MRIVSVAAYQVDLPLREGRMSAGSAPGLGVVPDPAVLGEAVFTVR